jgi:hypothetical protein
LEKKYDSHLAAGVKSEGFLPGRIELAKTGSQISGSIADYRTLREGKVQEVETMLVSQTGWTVKMEIRLK